MKFIDAILAAKGGARIRQPHWWKTAYIQIYENKFWIYVDDTRECKWEFTRGVRDAAPWEIIK